MHKLKNKRQKCLGKFMVRIILENKVMNTVSAYVPQVAFEKRQKEEFWWYQSKFLFKIFLR